MKRTVLIFGVLSGLVSSAMMFISMPLMKRGTINFDNGEVIGYTTIFLSFLLVFFGIRAYREQNGGTVSFGRAFSVGILITLISCVFYVASWLVIFYNFMPDFGDRYAKAAVAKMRKSGASEAVIAAKTEEMKKITKLYENPVTNAAVTFIEPFPMGLVVTLVSAGILRRKRGEVAPPVTTAVVA